MNKFLFACALSLIVGLGTSGNAHAQLSYNYSLPLDGGIEHNAGYYTGYGPQIFREFYSPLTGYMSQSSGTMNTLWSSGSYTSLYSPFTGYMSESKGTIQTPFGLASYLNYYSPYTGNVTAARLNNSSNSSFYNGFGNITNVVPFNYYGHPWWNGANGSTANTVHHR